MSLRRGRLSAAPALTALAGVLLVPALHAQAADAESSAEDAADKAAFNQVCGRCHPTTMVNDFRVEAEWTETVDQMITLGAKGTEEQFQRVLRYLARTLTKVNVNTGDAPQIAPVLDLSEPVAQALVAYRSQHGTFKTLDDLKKVPGIDPSKIEARKDRIFF